MSDVTIHVGDCIEQMRNIPDESVDTVITSPPYWGLRDYGGDGKVWGYRHCYRADGETKKHHEWEGYTRPSENTRKNNNSLQLKSAYWEPQEQAFCKHCDAWFGQLGLEPTPEQYVKNMVKVFDEVKRILKPEGTLWLNLGDTYYNYRGANNRRSDKDLTKRDTHQRDHHNIDARPNEMRIGGLKSKDLMGIPWRIAFALQESGWWLRQDIIWAKPNCMPESVKDRCTKNHEYLFLLTKSANYYYDNEAIKEPVADATRTNYQSGSRSNGENKDRQDNDMASRNKDVVYTTRNKRSVWWVGPKPFKGAHFAVFPIELIEPCVLAGTSEYGCCAECGAPYTRIVEKEVIKRNRQNEYVKREKECGMYSMNQTRGGTKTTTKGWRPTCKCDTTDTIPAVVFDPFGGSGTTAIAAIKHGRKAILTELNPDYVKIAEKRISDFKQEVGLNKNEVEWV